MLPMLEESMINFVKWTALKDQWNDPYSAFDQQAIPIQTVPNNGIIKTSVITYTNKCCFLSIFHGLQSIGIDFIEFVENTPINLMILSNFLEVHTMIDTDNKKHIKCLEKLVSNLPNIQLHFFIGKFIDNVWMTTPDPSVIIGSGKNIIRILNKGAHFEYITSDANVFLREIKTMTTEVVTKLQLEEEKKIEDFLKSEELAKRIHKEEEELFMDSIRRKYYDELYVKQIMEEENMILNRKNRTNWNNRKTKISNIH